MTQHNAPLLTGWGRTSSAIVPTARPERLSELGSTFQSPEPLTVAGLGRSYGDAAVPVNGGQALLLHRLNRLLAFDETSGDLVAEAGVTLRDIVDTFLPRGWMIPVSPGTALVTLGGAIAQDVHGKNHLTQGSFGRHIQWIDLQLASGEELRVSRSENPEIFCATLGGIGLTGIILRASLRLMKVPGQAMRVTGQRRPNLDSMLEAFADMPAEDDYAVAWLDCVAGGKSMGRGIFESAHHVAAKTSAVKTTGPSLPMDFPGFALNPLSIGIFNTLRYYWVGTRKAKTHDLATQNFLYPLDAIGNWNRMYGKRGFHQFQAVVPREEGPQSLRRLLEEISRSRRASFLAVMKRHGAEGEGLLSFPRPGYTLALDFPNAPGAEDLLRRLITITRDVGGRIYLAKDSVMTGDDLAAMYPRLPLFRQVIDRLDPQGRLTSQMAVRLGLRGVR
jgi:decaprenylphospho-beta-D-ribofuranose 2-oxidase